MMEPTELEVLVSIEQRFIESVDPVGLASILNNQGVLGKDVYHECLHMFVNGQERSEIGHVLLTGLVKDCTMSYLINALQVMGYANLRELILDNLARKSEIRGLPHVYRTKPRAEVDTFYHNLKKQLYNSSFKNPEEFLHCFGERMILKLRREACIPRRQLLADKCIVLLAIEIDAIVASGSRSATEILQSTKTQCENMRLLIPVSSNSILADVLYYSRLANLQAICGKFDEGHQLMTRAQGASDHIVACFQMVGYYYTRLLFSLDEAWSVQSDIVRRSFIQDGYMGLMCLQNEDVDKRMMWQRMFLIKMIFCLLGIGNKANVNVEYKPNNTVIQEVTGMLSMIDQCWKGIEMRREMFYYVARARVSEISGEMNTCNTYIERALKLAQLGRFKREIGSIRVYIDYMHTRLLVTNASHESLSFKATSGTMFLQLRGVHDLSLSSFGYSSTATPTADETTDKTLNSTSNSIALQQCSPCHQSAAGISSSNIRVSKPKHNESLQSKLESSITLLSAISLSFTSNDTVSTEDEDEDETFLKTVEGVDTEYFHAHNSSDAFNESIQWSGSELELHSASPLKLLESCNVSDSGDKQNSLDAFNENIEFSGSELDLRSEDSLAFSKSGNVSDF